MMRVLFFLAMLARPLAAEPVVVFAAASLKAPLDEIYAGTGVVVSYGGSGAMAQQIARGAPAEIFISANAEWMDWLDAEGLILSDTRRDLLGNSLVLVNFMVAGEVTPELLLGNGEFSIAIGQRSSVPAGQYAIAALESLGLLEAVEGRLIEVASVAAVSRLVLLREADFGIVYLSEAHGGRLPIAARFPAESHPPIVYPMALTRNAGQEAAWAAAILQTDAAREVFESYGFEVLP